MREETLRAANLAILDHHQKLPLTVTFGSGTLSSSDGQRSRPAASRPSPHSSAFSSPAKACRPTSTSPISAPPTTPRSSSPRREAHYVLDEILATPRICRSASMRPIPGGALGSFALFDLLGMPLSPRIRGLARSPCTSRDRNRRSGPASRVSGRRNALAAALKE
ncbi:Tn3 family transposase [Nocardia brasiliensis]|uniref:Tn3 family transposase n=1 Tax=Nocardia brasiliensis TaxID=37326 RepID=UPI003D79ADB7